MLRFLRCPVALALCLCAAILVAPTVHAGDKASAEALFREGKALMKEGRVDEACPKFQASWQADPAIGALLNLALCHQQQGKTASAWAEFSEAAEMARRSGDSVRAKGAQAHADELEPDLSHLTIVVEEQTPGLVIERNGIEVAPGSLGTAIPVNPGEHEIVAHAPDHRRWATRITVAAGGGRQSVSIPGLSALTESDDGDESDAAAEGGSAQAIVGWSLIGLGGVGLAVGIVLGVEAKSQVDDLEAPGGACENQVCTPEGRDDLDDATTIAHASTALYVLGGAFLVGGVVLLLTAPSDDESASDDELAASLLPSFGPSGAGLTVTGRF